VTLGSASHRVACRTAGDFERRCISKSRDRSGYPVPWWHRSLAAVCDKNARAMWSHCPALTVRCCAGQEMRPSAATTRVRTRFVVSHRFAYLGRSRATTGSWAGEGTNTASAGQSSLNLSSGRLRTRRTRGPPVTLGLDAPRRSALVMPGRARACPCAHDRRRRFGSQVGSHHLPTSGYAGPV